MSIFNRLLGGKKTKTQEIEDCGLAKAMGVSCLTMASEDAESDFLRKNKIDKSDSFSFFFSLAILNTTLASWVANVTMTINDSRKILILDRMLEVFMSEACKFHRTIPVRAITKSSQEINHVLRVLGSNSSHNNIKSYLDILYNSRAGIYEEKIASDLGGSLAQKRGSKLSPFSSTIKAFIVHAHGDSSEIDLLMYMMTITPLIMSTYEVFVNMCKEHAVQCNVS